MNDQDWCYINQEDKKTVERENSFSKLMYATDSFCFDFTKGKLPKYATLYPNDQEIVWSDGGIQTKPRSYIELQIPDNHLDEKSLYVEGLHSYTLHFEMKVNQLPQGRWTFYHSGMQKAVGELCIEHDGSISAFQRSCQVKVPTQVWIDITISVDIFVQTIDIFLIANKKLLIISMTLSTSEMFLGAKLANWLLETICVVS
eukprot:TRINITY_DN6849_c0_g1_i1.p1 TRINITY_DN6849_c0_g1~~TRINITY_DN6849_c0_g1_i1.p1  ORF type:complete len:201 (+),score=25.73 TRINITY_DN6849_c0_g1_i1:34-636(+)